MAKFDLERAKAGDPVQTVDGTPVTLTYYDMKGTDWPILGVIHTKERDIYHAWNHEGRSVFELRHLSMKPKELTSYVVMMEDTATGKKWMFSELCETEELAEKLALESHGSRADVVKVFAIFYTE